MSNKAEERSHFWTSYVDLMTSLFIIMLVLFILCLLRFNKANKDLEATVRQMETIKQIEQALNQLNRNYFSLDPENNRYKLLVKVNFPNNSADITAIDTSQLHSLDAAGNVLYKKMKELSGDKKINYLLIVEGLAERNKTNYKIRPHMGDSLSYERALSLKNYWARKGYDFSNFSNCEVLIVGSGYFGRARDLQNESNNRRFTIQITPKFKIY